MREQQLHKLTSYIIHKTVHKRQCISLKLHQTIKILCVCDIDMATVKVINYPFNNNLYSYRMIIISYLRCVFISCSHCDNNIIINTHKPCLSCLLDSYGV